MPARDPVRSIAAFALAMALALAGSVHAQSTRDAQRRLDRVQRELKDVAAERRRIENQRGSASQALRAVDERVGQSGRALRETEAGLARERAALAQLRQRRDALRVTLGAQRGELAGLLRAAYAVGAAAPLKVMLAQDRVADASRALAYHGYLQRQRAQRIAALSAELAELDRIERDIAQRQAALDAARAQQRTQLATLERDRAARGATIAQLDQRYRDRKAREAALGSDAKALQRLLAQLRAAAAKAAAERAATTATPRARDASRARASGTRPAVVASAPPIQVGGLGWPVSGALLAGYGGRLPDGRASTGLLIGAASGATVRAVADGTVVFSEWMTGYGLILIVDHGNGYLSLYAHNDALLKDAGVRVKRGDAVAAVGNSGGQDRPALYFELRRNGQPVNPNTWLQKR